MFKESKAFASYSIKNQAESFKFYKNILGLDVVQIDDTLLSIQLKGGFKILMYTKSDHTPATFTVLNFPVDNLTACVDELTQKNVVFEIYNDDYIQTDAKGVFDDPQMKMRIAWFKDPSGNILSLIENR